MPESDEVDEFYHLVLRVPAVCIVAGYLSGAALYTLDYFRIDYRSTMNILPRHEKSRSIATQLIYFSGFFLAIFVACLQLCEELQIPPNNAIGWATIILSVFIALPIRTCLHDFINFIAATASKVFFPSSEVSFIEVLIADAFTSMSRTFSDAGLTLLLILSSLKKGPPQLTQTTRLLTVIILSCLPSLLRTRQCYILRTVEVDPQKKFMHAVNMGWCDSIWKPTRHLTQSHTTPDLRSMYLCLDNQLSCSLEKARPLSISLSNRKSLTEDDR
jgi:hypothetical protein